MSSMVTYDHDTGLDQIENSTQYEELPPDSSGNIDNNNATEAPP